MSTIVPIMETSSAPDRIARVLFGGVRREVLALLLGRPEERFYLREIVRMVGAGSGAVQRELAQLVDAELLCREVSGRQVYFSANRDCVVYEELRAIVEKTAGVADVLRTCMAPLHRTARVDVAFVYGSVARGAQRSPSDVDVMIIGDVSMAQVVPALRDAERLLGREVNATVFPPDEWRAKIANPSAFLRRVLDTPKIFVTGGEHELARLAR